jgi:hypothetical protein
MCNYLSERLKLMFFQTSFINPIEKCAQEGLDIDLVEHIPESPSALVNWLDKPPAPSSILSRTNPNQQTAINDSKSNNNGLLWILEGELIYLSFFPLKCVTYFWFIYQTKLVTSNFFWNY